MKKELAMMLALFVVLSLSANASRIMPDEIESLSPGDSITKGDYEVSKGMAESSFHPWGYGSALILGGDGDTGGMITQHAESLGITGTQLGDVDRQYTVQSADAFIVKSASGLPWDPENPATTLVSKIGLTKDNDMRFSGAIVQTDPTLVTGTDINKDGITDDPYSGDHVLQWLEGGVNPSLTVGLSDCAVLTDGTRILTEELTDATVTISADPIELTPNVFQITDIVGGNDGKVCIGADEIWSGIRYPAITYPAMDPDQHLLATSGDIADYSGDIRDAQLTELMGYAHSEALLTTISTQTGSDPGVISSKLAGDGHIGGAFENAIIDPGVTVTVDPTGKFNFDLETMRPVVY